MSEQAETERTINDPNSHPDEAGAYIGRLPERQAETIPGGVRDDDERIAAYGSSSGKVGRDDETPGGHRGNSTDEGTQREAGENH
jgi:hypothetical protein